MNGWPDRNENLEKNKTARTAAGWPRPAGGVVFLRGDLIFFNGTDRAEFEKFQTAAGAAVVESGFILTDMKRKTTGEKQAELQRALCSAWALDSTSFAWDNRWGMPLEAAATGAFAGDDVMQPPEPAVFQQARRWARLHAFIRNVLALRLGFYNYGLLGERLVPVNPKKPEGEQALVLHPGIRAVAEKDTDRVTKWKVENTEEISRVVTDAWTSYLLLRNAVALWRKTGRVILRQPETCGYSDVFGAEVLTIKHGLTDKQITEMPGLSAAERLALKSSAKLKLTHDDRLFFFKVLKDESVGMGFAWPDLATIFHACSLNESLLVGDRQLADACRTVYEQHKLGHEIKSGNHAGSPAHFVKQPRAEAVKKEITGKKGHIQMATNFDHEILIGAGRPNPNQFATERYKQVAEQLATWGMPFAQMLTGTMNPFLMTLARTQAGSERQRMRPFLTGVLTDALKAPAPIMLQWGDECFWDSRLLLDVIKTGFTSGPMSSESFLRNAGLNPTEERAAKLRDHVLPPEALLPVFDAAHGQNPKGEAGKPPGKNDKDKK